jgi:hypothetical protein
VAKGKGDGLPAISVRRAQCVPKRERRLSSLGNIIKIIKCNAYRVSRETRFAIFSAGYDRNIPTTRRREFFMYIYSWSDPFDLESDCVAVH